MGKQPKQCYIICCTPRSGSHLLADGLSATGVAGRPAERFPKFCEQDSSFTSEQADEWVTERPTNAPFDVDGDRKYIEEVLEDGMTENGVFGFNLHWFQFDDAVRRLRAYTGNKDNDDPRAVFERAFPNLSYIWLRRQDKVAQAVSWYKAILTLQFHKIHGGDAKAQKRDELAFNYRKIQKCLSSLQNGENCWAKYLATCGKKPIIVQYEDFVGSYSNTIQRVMFEMGLAGDQLSIPAPRYLKTADELSDVWIRKFKSISEMRD
jgi:LPS sulfotransferase NodH